MFKNKFGKRNSKGYEDIQYSCKIRFLDDSEPITLTFQKDTKGQLLLDHVCRELNLVEKAYFGLRYVDTEKQRFQRQDTAEADLGSDPSGDPPDAPGHWLDPLKPVYRQLKHVNPMVLCFRVKFYPTDPMKLKEEITRYFLFLQLRRDLHHGRLLCSPQDANLLAAYIIQSEVGDYDVEDHPPGYVAQFKMLPKQTAKQEEKIAEIHKGMASNGGCTVPSEAESNFLKRACQLDTYGVDPHPVKDQKGNQMYLGVTHLGIVTFQGNKRTHLFKWPQINKIAFEGKMFIVHVTISEGEESSPTFKRKKHACGFKCPTFTACKHLWKCAIEQQYFFTLNYSTDAPKVTSSGSWFTRGSKFRFSGRCQKEVYTDSASILRDPPQFERSLSNPQFVRSFNKLRSTSMPSKFRDKSQDIGDVMENNHNSLTNVAPSMMTRSHELQDMSLEGLQGLQGLQGVIPEERCVLVADTAYQPLDSPQTDEAVPGFPGVPPGGTPTTRDAGGGGGGGGVDLDSQIQDLQNQLDQCRLSTGTPGPGTAPGTGTGTSPAPEISSSSSSNHLTGAAPDALEDQVHLVGGLPHHQPQQQQQLRASPTMETLEANGTKPSPPPSNHCRQDPPMTPVQAPPGTPGSPATASGAGAVAAGRAALTVAFLLLTAVLLVILVLETDLALPGVMEVRHWPSVHSFKHEQYEPFKAGVLHRVGGWFNRA